MDRERLRAAQWIKLERILRAVSGGNGFYGTRLRAVGVPVPASLGDFAEKVPLSYKSELLEDRLAHPPFGSNLTEPLANYTRFCQTSGTSTGQPMAWLDTPQSWESMLQCWRRVYVAAGLVPGVDRLFFAFSFGPFLGFWTAFEAGATDYLVIPGGGLSSQGRLQAMANYGATVLCCTPTYALRLGEQIGAATGVERQQLSVRKVIVAGEAGGSVPAVREKIARLWGAEVFDHHGMTEVGPVTYELQGHPGTLAVIEEAYFAEIVDPKTGKEVAEGECGELILTTLDRTACPLLRYRTGDWVKKRIIGGRLCLEGGILSRVDDMVVVRGVNVYPSAVEEIVRQFAEVDEFLVESHKVDEMDELRLRIELQAGADASLAKKLEARLKEAFSLRIPVILEPANSLPRHEFKARRWQIGV
ncbi:MAG: AMP-binding protein [Verrucomicrobiaceae bacterium]|nr:AMP-binding protein [Verrucomicrobiaceae bacterium]